jgi:hypothetical protein
MSRDTNRSGPPGTPALAGGILLMLTVAMLGCSSTPDRRSASEFYDASGNRIAEGGDTFEHRSLYRFAFDDVFDAAESMMLRAGFQTELADREKGVLQGSGMIPHMWSGGQGVVPFTICIAVREVSDEPRTELTMKLDAHWGVFANSLTFATEDPAQKRGPEFVAQLQQILATYE